MIELRKISPSFAREAKRSLYSWLLHICSKIASTNKSGSQMLVLLSFFFLTGCRPESLPISVEPAESQIAVASLVGPEEFMFLSLTKSFSALSAESISEITEDFIDALFIDSALVTLRYDGVTDTLNTFFGINGLYFSELQNFNEFQVMELSVFDSTTSETATAQSVLQPPVEVDSVIITRRDTTINFISDIYFSFEDPPNLDNYFVMQIYQLTPPDTAATDSTDEGNFFFSDNNFLIYERIFTDRGVDEDGRIRRDDIIEFSSNIDSALVVLTNIEEGYYNFLEARGRSGGLLSSLANEPVNHPTNISNGVGYFSAHQPRAKLVIVKFDEE